MDVAALYLRSSDGYQPALSLSPLPRLNMPKSPRSVIPYPKPMSPKTARLSASGLGGSRPIDYSLTSSVLYSQPPHITSSPYVSSSLLGDNALLRRPVAPSSAAAPPSPKSLASAYYARATAADRSENTALQRLEDLHSLNIALDVQMRAVGHKALPLEELHALQGGLLSAIAGARESIALDAAEKKRMAREKDIIAEQLSATATELAVAQTTIQELRACNRSPRIQGADASGMDSVFARLRDLEKENARVKEDRESLMRQVEGLKKEREVLKQQRADAEQRAFDHQVDADRRDDNAGRTKADLLAEVASLKDRLQDEATSRAALLHAEEIRRQELLDRVRQLESTAPAALPFAADQNKSAVDAESELWQRIKDLQLALAAEQAKTESMRGVAEAKAAKCAALEGRVIALEWSAIITSAPIPAAPHPNLQPRHIQASAIASPAPPPPKAPRALVALDLSATQAAAAESPRAVQSVPFFPNSGTFGASPRARILPNAAVVNTGVFAFGIMSPRRQAEPVSPLSLPR